MNIREHIQSIHPLACSTCNDLVYRETGWLIEKKVDGSPMWLTSEWQFGWTDNSNNAIRFCRRSDAEQIASMFENDDIQVTEHCWMPSILELTEHRQKLMEAEKDRGSCNTRTSTHQPHKELRDDDSTVSSKTREGGLLAAISDHIVSIALTGEIKSEDLSNQTQ
jgi:hypothetical protein